MPLTRDFRETVMERMKSSPEFRVGMLREGIDALLGGEFEVGKDVLRDYINATLGFERLGKKLKIPPKSLMRMLSPAGNPQARNLFEMVAYLQKVEGTVLEIRASNKVAA